MFFHVCRSKATVTWKRTTLMSQTLKEVRRRKAGRIRTKSMWWRRWEQRTGRKEAKPRGSRELTHPEPGGEGQRVTVADGRTPV